MTRNELFKKVRKIEIKAKGLSQNIFAGEYHSAFKGRGMTFSEVREYQYGDDVRDIDWNVTARYGHPYVKVYEEEREVGVIFFSDKIERFIPPQKGRKHILLVIRELLDFKPTGTGTDINHVLEYMTSALKKRCTTFLVSDFIDSHDYEKAMSIANHKHDLIAILLAAGSCFYCFLNDCHVASQNNLFSFLCNDVHSASVTDGTAAARYGYCQQRSCDS